MQGAPKGNQFAKGRGRPAGVPNKSTTEVREFFKLFLERNMDKMDAGWSQVYEKDPARAITILLDTAEYVVPKLQRTELTAKDGEELLINIDIFNGTKT